MRRSISAALALAVISTLAVSGAQAHHCDRNVVLFPQPYGLNANAVWCVADGGDDFDGRIIPPGSTGVSVRYLQDLGESVPRLDAVLSGSLFPTPRTVRLNRTVLSTGGVVYDSGSVSFPGGRTSSGCAHVTVLVPDDDPDDLENETDYYTLDSSC